MDQVRVKIIAIGINLLETDCLETITQSSRRYELISPRMAEQADIVLVNIDDNNAITLWKKHLDRPGRKTIIISESHSEFSQAVCLERRLLQRACHARRVLEVLDRVAPAPSQVVRSRETVESSPQSGFAGKLGASKRRLLGSLARWMDDLHEEEKSDNPYYS